jgi:hypothetical protein
VINQFVAKVLRERLWSSIGLNDFSEEEEQDRYRGVIKSLEPTR